MKNILSLYVSKHLFFSGSSKQGNSEDVLEGFCLASQPPLVKKQYPAPTLPPDFKPIHLKSVNDITKKTNITVSRHALTASGRSVLLGEKKFQKVSSEGKTSDGK